MFKKILMLTVFSAVVFVNGTTYAAPVISYGDQNAAWVTALTDPNDLLQSSLASYTATGNFNQWNLSPLGAAALNDGRFFIWSSQFATWSSNAVVEYRLNTSVNTFGYTITNINTYGGWPDSGRDAQQYSIYYSVVSDPNTFVLFDSVNYNPATPGSWSLSRLAWSTNLQNVSAIRFVASASVENGGTGMCEIDVIGTPSAGVAPVVDAGAAQSVWLTGGIVDVSLNGTVTSSASYTVLWSVVGQPAGSTVVFTPAAANAEDLSVRLDKAGTYVLKLTADNGAFTSSATTTVTVYANECAYAQAQSGFVWRVGDLNDDCEVNLADLAILAANWLECYHPDCP